MPILSRGGQPIKLKKDRYVPRVEPEEEDDETDEAFLKRLETEAEEPPPPSPPPKPPKRVVTIGKGSPVLKSAQGDAKELVSRKLSGAREPAVIHERQRSVGQPQLYTEQPGWVTFRGSRKLNDGNFGSYEYSVSVTLPVGKPLDKKLYESTLQEAVNFVDENITSLIEQISAGPAESEGTD